MLVIYHLHLISCICGLQTAFLYSYTWGILQTVQDLKGNLQVNDNNSVLMEKKSI